MNHPDDRSGKSSGRQDDERHDDKVDLPTPLTDALAETFHEMPNWHAIVDAAVEHAKTLERELSTARSAGTRIVKTNDSGLGECPMCRLADKVQVVRVVDPRSAFVVKCHGCGLTTGTYHHPDFAASMWNSHLSLPHSGVAHSASERTDK